MWPVRFHSEWVMTQQMEGEGSANDGPPGLCQSLIPSPLLSCMATCVSIPACLPAGGEGENLSVQNKRGGKVKFQSIMMPAVTEFDHPEKGEALHGTAAARSGFLMGCQSWACSPFVRGVSASMGYACASKQQLISQVSGKCWSPKLRSRVNTMLFHARLLTLANGLQARGTVLQL